MIKEFIEKFCLYILCITIVSFPLYVFRDIILLPIIGYPYPSTFLEILVFISLIATFLNLTINQFDFNNFKTKFDLLILIFLGTAIFSLYKSQDLIGGLGILKAYFIEPILFYYCLIYQMRKTGLNFIVKSLLFSGFWVATLALLQKFTGTFSFVPNELKQGRVTSVYNSANSLSLYLSPVFILGIVKFLEIKKFQRILYLVLCSFFLLILYWTKSRGGVMALSIGMFCLIYSLLIFRYKILKKIWVIVPLTLLLLSLVFFYQIYSTYNFRLATFNTQIISGDTLQIRYYIWVGTTSLLKEHPFFGAGLNGFKTLYSEKYKLPQYPEEFQYPHNLILTFWVETGILGLTSFLLLLVSAFSLLIKNIYKSKNPILGAGMIAILTYWFMHGLVDVPYFKNDLSMEFFTVLALIVGWFETKKQNI